MPVFVTPARRKITSPAKRMIIHTAEKKALDGKCSFFTIEMDCLIYNRRYSCIFRFYYNRSPIQRVVFDQSTQETMAYQDAF